MASPTLNLTKGRDGYILHWKEGKMNYQHIACIFQVQYKKEAASWEVRACARGVAWMGEGGNEKDQGECHLPGSWLPAGAQSEGATGSWWSCPCAVSRSLSLPLVKELRLTELM